MNLRHLEIVIGQKLREAVHIRRFYSALRSPLHAQQNKLLEIIQANRNTAFGSAHHFDRINSIADFQSFVPPCQYEDLSPYIKAVMRGDKKQLTNEEPFMFATTSGTTSQPKFIPITESHLRDYTHAFQIHNYHLIEEFPEAAKGRFLIISSNDEEGKVPSGQPYGAISGLLNRRQPNIIRKHFVVPYELCKLKDVDTKYYLMLRIALAQEVSSISCCNPSSLLLLSDQLREHAEDLVTDLNDGTVKSCYAPPSHLQNAFSPYLAAHPQRAKELTRLLETEGTLLPKTVWPKLAVLSCWKGGPMSFYLEKIPDSYGHIPIRDFGYMASEGRGSIPINNDGAGGILAITCHFFEFVHEQEFDSPTKVFLTADQLEIGERYYIYFTTASGLYRYNINDLIEVVGFQANTPIIQFVRKGLGVSSITGEKLTEEQVLVALTLAVRQLSLASTLSHFTTEVALGYPPYYVCFAELNGRLPDSVKNEFIRIFDHSLRMQNQEYDDRRATKRLGLPVLRVLPIGTYTRLRQQRVSEGAPEAQVKIPLLSSPYSFSKKLEILEVS